MKTKTHILQIIDKLTEFGINPNVTSGDKICDLRNWLVLIYSELLNLNVEYDDTVFNKEPNFEYKEIRKNVEKNFPNFGWYHSLSDSHKLLSEPEITIGDAIDDVTDIIIDLLKVKWCFEHTSEKDALWNFQFLMKAHSEQHLVDFLKYLKDQSG